MSRGPVAVVSLLFLFAGCLGSSASDKALPTASIAEPGTGLKLVDLPTVDTPRTLEAAPVWKLAEWWKYRLVDGFTGATYEVTRVVAGAEQDNYLVGMPADGWRNAFLIFHIPGFGEVSRADLSFEVHDVRYEPLKFPLVSGATWETAFEGRPAHAQVMKVDLNTAEVHVWNSVGEDITLTYDATVGEITKYVGVGYATYEILDHGFNFEGLVTVPHMHDLIFQQVRVGALLSQKGPVAVPGTGLSLEPSPTESVHVDATYDRVSFTMILGTILPDTKSPQGFYSEKVTAPDGTVFQSMVTPADTPGLKISFYQADKPSGDWKFEHIAAGPGLVLTEGIAYHIYDIHLPSGHIMPSKGEHQHGSS